MSKPPGTAATKAKTPRTYATGGGDATASGINFQQSLGAVFGVWMLTEIPVDHRLRLGGSKLIAMWMETEAPLDDAMAQTSDGEFIAAQAKNSLSLSSNLASEFGKTVEQIVRHWRICRDGKGDKGWDRPLDVTRDRLVIAIGPDKPATARLHLARGLEARRQPGAALLNADERKALAHFDACVRLAWSAATTDPLADDTKADICRLTYVLSIDPNGADRAALAATLGPAMENPADASSALNLLERVAGDLMSARGGHGVPGLRSDLIGRGAKLAARPDYRNDIAALKANSLQTERHLRALEVVEADAGSPVGITRHCQAAVNAAALGGDLLVIGEPGAGKSAVINALGRALRSQNHDVLELAVDRFSVESLEGLSRALSLVHEFPEVLRAWDGSGSGFLLIDALDASRGGPAEAAFKRLIEAVIELKGRWSIVASIRTFDLRLGQNFRALFKGTPPNAGLQAEGFPSVRHVQIPLWSKAEFNELLNLSPRLAAVLRDCPEKLRELAMVPFNTRLVADLVADGAVSPDFTAIDSQIALLNLYWERRVERHGAAAEVCLHTVVTEMVANRALHAPRLSVAAANPQILDALIGEGVLVTDQRRSVQFRHHLLFDYVASRVFMDADAIVSGQAVFSKAEGLGLLLAPAMGFVLRGLWSEEPKHNRFWTAVSYLLSTECDPIIRSVAARMAAELPSAAEDVLPIAQAIEAGDSKAVAALSHVAGAVAVRLEDTPVAPLAPWVCLELEASRNPAPIAGVLRMLAFLLIDRVKDAALRGDLGLAVRALLAYGYTLHDCRTIATPAIGFVADTLPTDVKASIHFLSQVLTDERFDRFGPEELGALAHKIGVVARAAPDFAIEVYRSAYSKEVTHNRKTSMGGSQILRLTSNARQDFETARWSLSEYFPIFLTEFPIEATKAFLAAIAGYVARRHPIPERWEVLVIEGSAGNVQLQPDHSHIWAHEAHPQYPEDGEVLLSKFEAFLEKGEERTVLAAAEYAALHATLAVVWSRLFMAAAARGGALHDLLASYAMQVEFVIAPDTRKDAIDLVAAHYDQLAELERREFETKALQLSLDDFKYPVGAKRALLTRLFSTIGVGKLATEEARTALTDAPAAGEANRRLVQITTEAIEPATYYWLDEKTRTEPAVGDMIDAIDAVRGALHLEINNSEFVADLDGAMTALTTLKTQIDAEAVPDETLKRRAADEFARGTHQLVRSDRIGAETPAGTVATIVGWIESACSSSDPETDAETEVNFESSPSWASSARLEAAAAVLALCLKRREVYPAFRSLIDRTLIDPHPAVRMNAAVHLVRIWDLDRQGFWERAARIVADEQNRGVLDLFVGKTLEKLVWHGAPREVADLVLPLLDRLPVNEKRNAGIRGHLVQMALQFWLRFAFSDAAERVNGWVAAAVDNVDEVRNAIQWLRNAYTAGLHEGGGELPQQRHLAVALLATSVEQAAEDLASYGDFSNLTETQTARARGAMQIIDTACDQLYFSSGAFQHSNQQDARAPMTIHGAQTFFSEIAPTLRRIGQHGSPRTVYYLIQLLEHLVEADPGGVFDLIAFAVLNGGRRGGYEFESLGADLLAKLIGRYLADHKDVFEDRQRRIALVDTLETFVAAGWPAVRRLLYRLPELLQ